jgi:hypothetical protein
MWGLNPDVNGMVIPVKLGFSGYAAKLLLKILANGQVIIGWRLRG